MKMILRRWMPLCLLISALTACGGSPSSGVGSAADPIDKAVPSQLRRDGRFMVDEHQRVVLLHGVNAVWKTPPYTPPNTPEGFTAADADWLRDHGFNSVRLGVLFQGVMPDKGRIDTAYLAQVDRVVQLLSSRGIYVLFDFHQDLYAERFGGEGFPDWAVHDDGVPPTDVGFPGNYFTPAVERAFDNFWSNTDNLWDDYRDAWKAVAAKWKNLDHHGGYDLLNEPFPGSVWLSCANPAGCPVFDDQMLQPLQDHVRKGIREVDASNLVFYEPNFLFIGTAHSGLGLLTPITDPQIGLSWHKYCVLGLLLHSQGFTDLPTCTQFHQLVGANAELTIDQMGATTLLTEFGASDDLPDVATVVSQADSELTGWQYWHYKEWRDPTTESQDSGGQGLFAKDDDLSTVKVDKLKVLERAYPQATAGVPLALSFDVATAAFSYRYTPRAASAPTDIYLPKLHYLQGYTVTLTGARQLSAPGAAHLLIENLPGAPEVTVSVTRPSP